TLSLKPFCGVTVMVVAPFVPATMLKLSGDAESAKFGAVGVVIETLSKVAVASVAEPLLAAKPMNTLAAMGMICGEPSWGQVTPLAEAKPVKLLPLRPSFTQ